MLNSYQLLNKIYPLSEHCPNYQSLETFLNSISNNKSHRVETIILNDNHLGDDALALLGQLHSIKHLGLAATSMNGLCLAKILKIPGLKKLDLTSNPLVPEQIRLGLKDWGNQSLSLEEIVLEDCGLKSEQLIALVEFLDSKANNLSKVELGDLSFLERNAAINLYRILKDSFPNISFKSTQFDYFSNLESRNKLVG